MQESQKSYRQIIKATSIFGGVKVFTIIISIIRSKIIAVLLGPEGMGINGLFHSTSVFISGLTNFGLETSAVKNVAEANGTGDKQRIALVITVLRRLVWITGLLGTITTIIFSPWLSQITFGNKDYTIAFIWISVTLLLNQISIGQTVLLRGMRQINYLARSSLSGAVLGLIVSVPIYYKWGVDGIVPAIIITSIASLLRTWYFASKVNIEKAEVSLQTTASEGRGMIIMGFMISLSSLYVLAKNYGIRAYLSNVAGVEEVGLYSAGMTVVSTYVGMVFSAMSTDYYPRLAAVTYNNISTRKLVNQQAEIAVLILGPIITVFIVYINMIVAILYSTKFLPISQMIQWAALGMFFKATSWSIAYIILAKGKSKMFLFNELFAGTITLILQLLGYYWGGITGMGIGFLLGYFYYTLQVFFVTKHFFEFSFDKEFIRILIFQFLLATLSLIVVMFFQKPISYILGTAIILFTTYFSLKELDKRVEIRKLIKGFLKRN